MRIIIMVANLLVSFLLITQPNAPTAAALATTPMQTHVEAGLPEQDVFIERQGQPGVWRPSVADSKNQSNLRLPLFASAQPIAHDPFSLGPNPLGPFARGRALNLTLEKWLAAKGTLTYEFVGAKSRVSATFTALVPTGLYTVWYFRLAQPPVVQVIELPAGARNGTLNVFKAAANGTARWQVSFDGPVDRPTKDVATGFAIAWHSDNKTYGASPGPFGQTAHVQLFVLMPADAVPDLGSILTRLEDAQRRVVAVGADMASLQSRLAFLERRVRDLEFQYNILLEVAIILAVVAIVAAGYAFRARAPDAEPQ